MQMPSLSGRSVCVVGASGGLGAPVSRRLAAAGAILTLCGRDASRLESVVPGAAIVAADLTEPGTPDVIVQATLAAHGRLDGLVYAAGVVAFAPAAELPDAVLTQLFAVNTLAPMRLLHAAIPALVDSARQGREPFVANLSAVVAEQPVAGMSAYSASKAALTAFDHAAARELRRSRVRLIDVRPPHTETGLAGRPIFGSAPALPPGLTPDDVADRILAAVVGGERDLPSEAFGRHA
jgi:cyclic-di-GMP-binding biofilm dispersal mediator protein